MKILRRILLFLLLVIVIALVGGFVWFNDLTRGPLPQHSGELTVNGLDGRVEIIRDRYGVPHIYASTIHDLFFAQGFTHAQDRWWQMEFARHIGSGRIEELTGKTASITPQDVFIRTAGWRRAAEHDLANTSEEALAVLQAFADGVNAYIQSREPGDLALEYSILGLTGINITVEPWTPLDTITWSKIMAWNLHDDGDERDRSDLGDVLDVQLLNDLYLAYPYGEKPTALTEDDLPLSETSLSSEQASTGITGMGKQVAGNFIPEQGVLMEHDPGAIGSNNWVATGLMTESGGALLANDPHLGIQMPSIWYEIGLHCQPVSESCPFNIVGFAFPSSPTVIVGHNERIAWGVTDMTDDVLDYYRIMVNPDNPLQYQWNGEWRDMTVREETIVFGDGEPPLTIQVRETHLGPIINDNRIGDDGELLGFNNEDPLALRWTAFEDGTLIEALLRLNTAANWEDFRDALRYWDIPSQNIVYADVDGNIGYQMPGRIPIRAAGHDGTLPVDGSTDAYEWRGFIPYDSLPRIFNPARDYIVTANAAVAPLNYYDQLAESLGDEFEDANFQFTQLWDYGYRAQRIVELMEANTPHNVASFSAMQGDNKNLSATELLPALANVTFDDATLTEARDWLLTWDYMNDDTSAKAALYMRFWGQLVENLYDDQLTEDFASRGSGMYMWATYQLLDQPDNAWWDDITTADSVETRDDILVRAFREAYEANVSQFGENRESWRWGNMHTVTFVSNPLGLSGIDAIEDIFNRGPFTVGGGSSIVNATSWNLANDSYEVTAGPSFRMVIDMSDFTRSTSLHSTGQSGHPYSPHYDDLIDSWRNNTPHPLLWTREQVEAAQAARLILNP